MESDINYSLVFNFAEVKKILKLYMQQRKRNFMRNLKNIFLKNNI